MWSAIIKRSAVLVCGTEKPEEQNRNDKRTDRGVDGVVKTGIEKRVGMDGVEKTDMDGIGKMGMDGVELMGLSGEWIWVGDEQKVNDDRRSGREEGIKIENTKIEVDVNDGIDGELYDTGEEADENDEDLYFDVNVQKAIETDEAYEKAWECYEDMKDVVERYWNPPICEELCASAVNHFVGFLDAKKEKKYIQYMRYT